MKHRNCTEMTLEGFKKWGKPGKNAWQQFMDLLSKDAWENRQRISIQLFDNLMIQASKMGCITEFDGFRIKKLKINYHGMELMVKPIVQNDRVVFFHNQVKYIDGAKVFGETINSY